MTTGLAFGLDKFTTAASGISRLLRTKTTEIDMGVVIKTLQQEVHKYLGVKKEKGIYFVNPKEK